VKVYGSSDNLKKKEKV